MTPDEFYALLPAIYRIRDLDNGRGLEALMRVIGQQVQVVHADIQHLYNTWFIETCDDWAVPYIGELVGFRRSTPFGEPGDTASEDDLELLRRLYPRREVSSLVECRQRKGIRQVFEDLAGHVAGWRGSLIECHRRIISARNTGHSQAPDYGSAIRACGSRSKSESVEPKFAIHVGGSLRRIPSGLELLVWRRDPRTNSRAIPVAIKIAGQAAALDLAGKRWQFYSLSAFGHDQPLAVQNDVAKIPRSEQPLLNTTRFLKRRMLERDLRTAGSVESATNFYGKNRCLVIENRPAQEIAVRSLKSLSTFRSHINSNVTTIVDPEVGRIALRSTQPTPVDFLFAAKGEIGAGEYTRLVTRHNLYEVHRFVPDFSRRLSLDRFFQTSIGASSPESRISESVGFEFAATGIYDCGVNRLRITAGQTLELRASNQACPILKFVDTSGHLKSLVIEMERDSQLIVDGLSIWAQSVSIEYVNSASTPPTYDDSCGQQIGTPAAPKPPQVFLRHCTIVPRESRRLVHRTRGSIGTLKWCVPAGSLSVTKSILAEIIVQNSSEVTSICPRTPPVIDISHSIIHRSITVANNSTIGAALTCRKSTILGTCTVHQMDAADDMIFLGKVRVERKQVGAIRYSFVRSGPDLPRRFKCVPKLTEYVRPKFVSLGYGRFGYGELHVDCPKSIREGAQSGSEMGAYHNQFEPQRLARLVTQATDFTPVKLALAVQLADESTP